jgi:TRAP-type mannitol/chloroaromatic compound transport system permease small subunit
VGGHGVRAARASEPVAGNNYRAPHGRGDFMDRVLQALLGVSRVIDAVNVRLGKWISWLILAAVLVSAINASVRKAFDTSSNAWLELQWVLFGTVFLLCSPWTLRDNEHIRIDIVNNALPKRVRNWIDLVGHALFLLPLTVVMMVTSVPFAIRSYNINEQSFSAGGLPQWPAKALVLIGFVLLFFQSISELIKRIAIMRGLIPDPHESGGGLLAAAEAEVARLLADPPPEAR